MDFTLTEEQQEIRSLARKFAREEVEKRARHIDETAEFDWDLHRRMGGLGFFGTTAPESYGGANAPTLTWCLIVEAIAEASTTVSNGITLTESMIHYIAALGNEEQKGALLPALIRGEKICAFGLTEPGAGSDAASIVTTAKPDGEGFILNGQKMFISGALLADFFIIVATVDKAERHKGIRTFIVDRRTPGLSCGPKLDLLGVRGFGTAQVFLDNCRVPASAQLGNEDGFRSVMHGLDGPGRLGAASQAVGLAQAAMNAALRYALEREQFGQPLFEFQAVQFMLADMSAEIEAARLLVWHAASRRDAGLSFTKESSHAKLFAGDMCFRTVGNAMQIFGGYSYSKDYPIERYYREAKIHQIWDGTNQIQRIIIARQLKKEMGCGIA
jgi:alkylation response protein AidB-like acyl-CoA dehydrogenase